VLHSEEDKELQELAREELQHVQQQVRPGGTTGAKRDWDGWWSCGVKYGVWCWCPFLFLLKE